MIFPKKGGTRQMKRLLLDIEDDKHQKLKEWAVKNKVTMKKIISDLVSSWIKQQHQKKG